MPLENPSRRERRAIGRRGRKLVLAGVAVVAIGLVGAGGMTTHVVLEGSVAQEARATDVIEVKAALAPEKSAQVNAGSNMAIGHIEQVEPKRTTTSRADEVDLPIKMSAGEPFALLTVPALGADWEHAVVEGTGEKKTNDDLLDSAGVVHYATTQQPGEKGNFAVSGHRWGFDGAGVFLNLDDLTPGDKATVTVLGDGTYSYVLRSNELGHDADNNSVIYPDPTDSTVRPEDADHKLLTITTCDYDFFGQPTHRIVATFEQTDYQPA